MGQDGHSDPNDAAAEAFSSLRAEISLLRRAVERLTDERAVQPDYAPSLAGIAKRAEDVCVWARRISDTPALQLTPARLSAEIEKAAMISRQQDKQMLDRAASAMEGAGARIDAMIARSRSISEQRRELLQNRIAFAVAGMALFAILPGAVARSLPARWAVPERIAARMLGTDTETAGQRMMIMGRPHTRNLSTAQEEALRSAPSE